MERREARRLMKAREANPWRMAPFTVDMTNFNTIPTIAWTPAVPRWEPEHPEEEHPVYTAPAWGNTVMNGRTRLSYVDWVNVRLRGEE